MLDSFLAHIKDSVQTLYSNIQFGLVHSLLGFPGGSAVKNLPANAGEAGSISGSRRCPGEANGNPLLLPGESPGTEEPRGLWSMGLQRVRHDLVTKQKQQQQNMM